MNFRGRIGGRKLTEKTTTFLVLFLDDYMRKHDPLCLSHPLGNYILGYSDAGIILNFSFCFVPSPHTPCWINTNTVGTKSYFTIVSPSNGFLSQSTVLYTSCPPLLADFMVDKGQSPTLSFLNVSVTKMFLLPISSRSNIEVKKFSRNGLRGSGK